MTAELPPELRRAIEEAVHRATDVVERFGNRMTRLERSIPRLLPPDQEAAEERRQESLARWEAVRDRERRQ